MYGPVLRSMGIAIVETPGGLRWALDLRNPCHRWCVYGSNFAPATANWIRESLQGGGDVIDSGANIGQAVIEFSQYPGIRVFAFEPLPECQKWIKNSCELNPDMDVEVLPFGLWKASGKLEIQVAGGGEIHGAHSTLRMDWFQGKNYDRLQIDLVALDEFADSRGLNEIRFWKLDVEGAELEALMGAEHLLSSRRIQSMLVETKAHTSGVMDYLAQFGYLPYVLDRKWRLVRWTIKDKTVSDYIFLPNN